MYLFETFLMDTPDACVVDLTPPTFAGIDDLVANVNGSILASWLAGSDAGSPPVKYNVYVKKDTATGLFSSGNFLLCTPLLEFNIYQTPDGLALQEQATYHVGVRAVDGLGNESSNTQSLSVVSNGVFEQTLADLADAVRSLIRASEVNLVGEIVQPEELVGDIVQPDVLSGELVDEC